MKKKPFKYSFWGGRFHVLPQSYKCSHSLFLNKSFQVWLIGNQRYQVPLFIYINQADEVSHFIRGGKFPRHIKYLMRSVLRATEAVGIWTEENWDVKRVNSLYTMVSGMFN